MATATRHRSRDRSRFEYDDSGTCAACLYASMGICHPELATLHRTWGLVERSTRPKRRSGHDGFDVRYDSLANQSSKVSDGSRNVPRRNDVWAAMIRELSGKARRTDTRRYSSVTTSYQPNRRHTGPDFTSGYTSDQREPETDTVRIRPVNRLRRSPPRCKMCTRRVTELLSSSRKSKGPRRDVRIRRSRQQQVTERRALLRPPITTETTASQGVTRLAARNTLRSQRFRVASVNGRDGTQPFRSWLLQGSLETGEAQPGRSERRGDNNLGTPLPGVENRTSLSCIPLRCRAIVTLDTIAATLPSIRPYGEVRKRQVTSSDGSRRTTTSTRRLTGISTTATVLVQCSDGLRLIRCIVHARAAWISRRNCLHIRYRNTVRT